MKPLTRAEEMRIFFEAFGPRRPPTVRRRAIPRAVRADVLKAGVCAYCPTVLVDEHNHPAQATVDHRIPRAKGGTDARANLVAACRRCNTRKSTRSAEEFARRAS